MNTNIELDKSDFCDDQVIYPESFDKIPTPIIHRAFLMLAVTLIIAAVIVCAHFLLPDFYYIEMLIAVLILVLYAAVKAFIIIMGTMKLGYICLKGSIVNVYAEKFDKKAYTIQMHDDERDVFISFKYSGGKDIEPETPVSLYLSSSEPIIEDPNLGNSVDGYLAVVFTTDNLTSGVSKKSAKQLLSQKDEDN